MIPYKNIIICVKRASPYIIALIFFFCFMGKVEKRNKMHGYVKHKEIAVYNNVCIQPGKDYFIIFGDVPYYKSAATFDRITIRVPVGNHTHMKTWDLEIRHEQLPHISSFSNTTAYFVKLSFASNIHHFWHDTLKGLFGAIKKRKEFHVDKHVYFNRSTFHSKCKKEIHGPKYCLDNHYKSLIHMLNVSTYVAYQEVYKLTCYKTAVFGYTLEEVKTGKVEKYIKNRVGMSGVNCSANLILIQQRKYRRITNADNLRAAISEAGFENTRIVDFENMSVPEQIKLASCSKILIGLHGAGLEWFRFMKKPAGLIEIGWKHWPPERFGHMARSEGYNTLQIFDCPAKLSEVSMHEYPKTNNGTYISLSNKSAVEELSKQSLNNPKWLPSNIWKYADCDVPVERIVESVKQMLIKIG